MTTRHERMHGAMRRALGAADNDQLHGVLDSLLARGPIPDEQLPLDKQGTPLAFGNARTRLGESMISDFNATGKRLRGE